MNKKIVMILSALLLCSFTAFSATAESTAERFIKTLGLGHGDEITEMAAGLDDAFFKTLTEEHAAPETDFTYRFNDTKDGVVITGYTGNTVFLSEHNSNYYNMYGTRIALGYDTVETPYGFEDLSIYGYDNEGNPVHRDEWNLYDANGNPIYINMEIIIIPAEIEGYPVTGIEKNILSNRSFISLIIPPTVQVLAEKCFEKSRLRWIYIPGSIKTIPKECFSYCQELSGVKFGSGIEKIGKEAFSNTYHLRQITLSNSVKEIEEDSFASSGIEQINLGTSFEVIGAGAFASSNIVSIDLPASIKVIASGAFQYCTNLHNISFNAETTELKKIGCRAFEHCTKLESVSLCNSIEIIGLAAFERSGLVSVTFSKGLKTIEAGAFSHCEKLRDITIPKEITQIDFPPYKYVNDAWMKVTWINVFNDCGKLKLKVRTQLEELGYKGEF